MTRPGSRTLPAPSVAVWTTEQGYTVEHGLLAPAVAYVCARVPAGDYGAVVMYRGIAELGRAEGLALERASAYERSARCMAGKPPEG